MKTKVAPRLEACPSNWLKDDGYYYYPPKNYNALVTQEQSVPEKGWKKHKVRTVYGTYNTYTEAMLRQSDLECETDTTDSTKKKSIGTRSNRSKTKATFKNSDVSNEIRPELPSASANVASTSAASNSAPNNATQLIELTQDPAPLNASTQNEAQVLILTKNPVRNIEQQLEQVATPQFTDNDGFEFDINDLSILGNLIDDESSTDQPIQEVPATHNQPTQTIVLDPFQDYVVNELQ